MEEPGRFGIKQLTNLASGWYPYTQIPQMRGRGRVHFFPDDRELLAGGKQRKEAVELTSERLSEIFRE